ncbi:hypothetical protein SNE40_023531 [Patella caerulea]|uniref:EGF-like domain-containing protein n=1 Tax=Patella caerulea TaxID=87958 RepID=A0AAN8IW83_PATCE
MYTYLILVYLVVALIFSSCTAHRKRWWNSPRHGINLRSLHCDKVDQFNLCRCCPVKVNPCENIECMNGGRCVGEGVCECASGYSGPMCNISPCDGVTCMNGGQCVGEGVCNCTFGFGGATCNTRVCNVTECAGRNGECFEARCVANATGCVDAIGDADGIRVLCFRIGDPCGEEGTFCISSESTPTKCVNGTCRKRSTCTGSDDGPCEANGSCSGGACFEPCSEDSNCAGLPCIGGFCTLVACGEPFCLVNP